MPCLEGGITLVESPYGCLMRFRPLRRADDLGRLERLFDACRSADGHAPLGDHAYLDLVSGGDPVGVVAEAEGEMVAYGHATANRTGGWTVGIAVHPRRRDPRLVDETLTATLEAAGPGEITCWVYHPVIGGSVRRLGFREDRRLLQLRRDLPPDEQPVFPAGITVAPFQVGADEAAWLEVNNRAFAGHPENGAWTPDILRDRLAQQWFDARGCLMARDGSVLVGFCWTKVHAGGVGEIYVIAVDPGYQGRSLGRALILAGLWYLTEARAASQGMLYVEADNDRALGLYRELGFHLDHVDQAFVLRF